MSQSLPNGRYSRVSRRMWNDSKVRKLSSPQPCGKFLFVWLLTIPDLTCIPGLFQAREAGLAEAIGWSLKGFRESFGELYREGLARADWDVGLIWLPNSIRHNEPANHKVVLHWAATWAELPECKLKAEAHAILSGYCASRGSAFEDAFAKACPYDSLDGSVYSTSNGLADGMPNKEQEQEQEQEQDQPISPSPRKVQVKSPISAEWQPSQPRLDAIAAKTGISVDSLLRQVPEFRLYWLPGGKGSSRKDAVKRACDWDQAFSNRIDLLIEWGKITVTTEPAQLGILPTPTGPHLRDDVQRLHDAWRRAFGRTGAVLRPDDRTDATALAGAIDAHGLSDCLLVASNASTDPWVSGKADDRGTKHDSVAYIFGKEETFSRILTAAKLKVPVANGGVKKSGTDIYNELESAGRF
jgi:hypothetical protein